MKKGKGIFFCQSFINFLLLVKNIQSEMEVAPCYTLLTLLTLLSVDMVYTIDTIQNALHCLNSSIMLLACMPVYIVREVEWTGVDTPSKGSKDCYDYCGTCSAIDKTF